MSRVENPFTPSRNILGGNNAVAAKRLQSFIIEPICNHVDTLS